MLLQTWLSSWILKFALSIIKFCGYRAQQISGEWKSEIVKPLREMWNTI